VTHKTDFRRAVQRRSNVGLGARATSAGCTRMMARLPHVSTPQRHGRLLSTMLPKGKFPVGGVLLLVPSRCYQGRSAGIRITPICMHGAIGQAHAGLSVIRHHQFSRLTAERSGIRRSHQQHHSMSNAATSRCAQSREEIMV
jgi:hypothetical protein